MDLLTSNLGSQTSRLLWKWSSTERTTCRGSMFRLTLQRYWKSAAHTCFNCRLLARWDMDLAGLGSTLAFLL